LAQEYTFPAASPTTAETVAVELVGIGLLDADMLRRFRAERQILPKLDKGDSR